MGRYLPVAKRPTIKLTRVDGESFCAKSRFEIRRHTLCISRVSNRRVGAKEPPATAGDFIVGCLKQRRRTQTAKLGCGRTPRMSYDLLGERSGSVGTPGCRTGFCVRRNKEPISDSQIRWIRASVLPIRRVDCCCSPKDR